MKIENRWFRWEWEKKKRGGTMLPLLLCLILLAGTFGGGYMLGGVRGGELPSEPLYGAAFPQEETQEETNVEPDEEDFYVEGNYVTSSYLASMTQTKWNQQSPYGYTYGEALTGLSRQDEISLQLGFALEDSEFEYFSELMQLFEDPELTHSVGNQWDYDQDTRVLTLKPTNYPVGLIGVGRLDTDTARKYQHDDLKLFPHDAGTDWGNLGTMYLAVYVDLETGEQLDAPQVQIVSLQGELPDTPRLSYSFTEDGRVRFSWTAVEGAEEYMLCCLNYSEEYGLDTFAWPMDHTTDTEWTVPAPQYGDLFANEDFRNFEVAEDDWYDSYYAEKRIAEYGETPVGIYKTDRRDIYCVIAVSENGTSMMSNQVDILDIQSSIPVRVAYDTWQANGFSYGGYDSVEELTPYGYVTMADGSTAMKLIDYDTENAIVVEDRYIVTDEDGNYLEGRNVPVLKIPYQIEGTPFEDVAEVVEYDIANLEKDMRLIEERENLLRKKAGDVALNDDIGFSEDEMAAEEIRTVDFEITANSALSEYLAMNMLSGVTVIDVSDFKEAADVSMLVDALLEAYYQNPLILGISGYKINRMGNAVKIAYEEDTASQARKQEELRNKVSEIIEKIIAPGMSELEKELAINTYLCETCTYDDAALENAESHDYRYVDEEFHDSFTAYGALISGDCVCAGYAAAFKLLADAAGLDCVVVTGVLEGTLPHAWNKVRIDGEWEILDVTNNDNEFLSNALLNLPDEAGKRTLTEDADYALDGYLHSYEANNGQREFYRLNGLYYPYDEIGEKLAEQLMENGVALLRTEYALDDETFSRIGREVYAALPGRDALYGYYWMGVIYLTYEE